LTILAGELDFDDLIRAIVDGGGPTDTGMTFGTSRLLSLPIDGKPTRFEARLLLGLPFDIGMGGADQVNAIVLLTTVQQLGIDIAGIDEMLLGQQVFLLEPFMNASGSCIIGDGSGRRFNMGDQMRAVFLARFRQMDASSLPNWSCASYCNGHEDSEGELLDTAAGGIFYAERQLSWPSLH
jgi:hypothetical protein